MVKPIESIQERPPADGYVFRTQSSPSDDAVFVRLQPTVGSARLVPLQRADDQGWWETRLELQPDVYRYRYYRKAGTTIMYHPPTPDEVHRFGPWDAELKVPAHREDASPTRYPLMEGQSA